MLFNLLHEATLKYKDKIALNYNKKKLTYLSLLENVNRIYDKLLFYGVSKNDHVAIIMNNSVEFVESIFAISKCSAVSLPFYINTGTNKIVNMINQYDAKFIITFKSSKGNYYSSIIKECPNIRGIFYLEDDSLEYQECNRCDPDGYSADDTLRKCIAFDDKAFILFSSGTTNVSKGVVLSNKNIESNVKAISEYLHLNQNDKILLVKNINHASSITGELLVSIYNGCELFITSGFPTASYIVDRIEKESITVFFAVPTLLMSILISRNADRSKLETLRMINFYGASIPFSEIEKFSATYPWIDLIYSYGLTEASPRVTYIYKDKLFEKKGSSGTPVNGVKVIIRDEYSKPIGCNCIGEITVSGPNVMQGYYKNEELTKKTLREGYLFTGDLGYVDEDNYLYVTGRKDNLIIQAGKNIFPEEVEGVIRTYPAVQEVLVKGDADDFMGQKIVAYILCKENCILDVRDILLHCKKNLEDYKIPRDFIMVDSLEKTQSGKIIRNSDMRFGK